MMIRWNVVRVMLLLVGAVCAANSAGCGEVDKQQFALRQEFGRNVELFGAVSDNYSAVADDMAGKKHDLQKQLIDRTSDQWIASHTDAAGNLVASAAETITFFKQRDGAMEQLILSKQAWSETSKAFKAAIRDLLVVSKTISDKDANAQKAKDEMTAAFKSIIGLAGTAGGGLAIGLGL